MTLAQVLEHIATGTATTKDAAWVDAEIRYLHRIITEMRQNERQYQETIVVLTATIEKEAIVNEQPSTREGLPVGAQSAG